MRWLFILLVSCNSLPILANPALFSHAEITLMHKVFSQHQDNFTREQTKTRLAENQFLLDQAQQHQSHLLARQSEVGYATKFHARRYVMSLLTSHFVSTAAPQKAVVNWANYTQTQLQADLPSYPNDNHYSSAQLKKLANIDLTSFSGAPLTLADLMHEQSMQNRYKLHQGDYTLFKQLLNEHRQYNRLIKHLKVQLTQSNISLKNLALIATGELIRSPMLSYFGVQTQMHGERSDYVEILKSNITTQDIKQFYMQHKADFKHKSTVYASGAIFSSSKNAASFKKAVIKTSFQKALSQHALNNIFAKTKGILTREHNSQWAAQVVFNLKESQLAGPIRSPNGQWLVAQTHQVKFDYYSVQSETVRYQATLALIEEAAKLAYQKNKLAWFKLHKLSL